MKLETPFIAVILASLFFIGMYTFFIDIGTTYEEAGMIEFDNVAFGINNNTDDFRDAFNAINATKKKVIEIETELSNLKPSLTSLWPGLNIVFKTGSVIIGSLLTTKDVATAANQALGIPPIVTDSLVVILIVIIILGVVAFLSGRTQG